MSHDMPTGRRIYEGKAKVLFEGPEDGTLVQYFKDDTTAFNAEKHEIMVGKAFSICASPNLFSRSLRKWRANPLHQNDNPRQQLIRAAEIIPLEVVIRNVAAGSLVKRWVNEGCPAAPTGRVLL